MKIDWEVIGVIFGIIGSITGIGGGFLWFISYRESAARKSYAAERAFEHIKKSQEQLSVSIVNSLQDIDVTLEGMKDELQELRFNCRGNCSLPLDKRQ